MFPTWGYVLILITLLSGGGYLYFTYTQNKIEALVAINAEQQKEIETANLMVQGLQDAVMFNEISYSKLQRRTRLAETRENELIRLYQEHDLTKLATEKPGLIEKRINEGTKEVFDNLESITATK